MKGEVNAEAVQLYLAETDVAGRDLDVRCNQDRQAVADPCFDADGEVHGREKIVRLVVVGHLRGFDSAVIKIIVVSAVLGREKIRGRADACEEQGIARRAEVVAEV